MTKENRAPDPIRPGGGWLVPVLAFFCLMVAVAAVAAAQSPVRDSLSMEARIGWDSAVRSGAWTPVTVWVSWQGKREIDGIVRVYDTSLISEVQFHEAPVTLAPPSRKRLDFTIPYTPGAAEIVIEFQSSDLPEGRRIRRSPRHWIEGDDVLVVVVARESSAVPSALHDWCRQWSARSTETEAVAVGIMPRDLTANWADYEPIDLLVFLDCGDGRFDPGAVRAVAEWVKAGGRILVTGGLEPALIEDTALWPLLPVTPGAIGSTDSLPAPLDSLGVSAGDRSAWFLREYRPRAGIDVRTWPGDGGSAALVARSAGGGWAAFSPLAPEMEPLAAGGDGVQFWSYVFLQARAGSSPALGGAPLEQDPSTPWYGYSAPDSPAFPLTALGIYLGAYFLLVGPVNYFYLRRKARFGLVWITVPALSVAFFLLAYLGGRLLWGDRLRIREVSLIEVFPALEPDGGVSPARILSRFRISSPARTSHDIGFGGGEVFVTQTMRNNPDNVKVQGFRIREVAGTEVADLGFNMWSSRFVYASGVKEVSGTIRGAASVSNGKLHGTVAVDVPFDFKGIYAYFKGQPKHLDLVMGEPGGPVRGRFEMSASGRHGRPGQYGWQPGMPRISPEQDDPGGEKAFQQAIYYLENSYRLSYRPEPWFIGVRNEPGRDLLLDGRPVEGDRFSVYLAALPIVSEGEDMTLPPALWQRKFHDPGGIITAEYRSIEIIEPGEVTWDFYPPLLPGIQEVNDLRIMVETNLLAMASRFEIRDHEGKRWVELVRRGPQSGSKTLILFPGAGSPNRFAERETGRLALRMTFAGRGHTVLNNDSVEYYYPGSDGMLPNLIDISARWRVP